MPFSRDAFFDTFATYNNELWPLALMLWVATLITFTLHPSERAATGGVFGLLAIQWTWSGLAYHAAIFSHINPAAWVFAALFVTQAGLLAWHGIEDERLEFSSDPSVQVVIGYALVAYGLLYPVLALAGGHVYPRVPTFGVPCPTMIVTAGFLTLLRGRVPVALAIVPLIWAVIGGSSAFLLGVPADFGLIVAGTVLAYRTWSTRAAAPA